MHRANKLPTAMKGLKQPMITLKVTKLIPISDYRKEKELHLPICLKRRPQHSQVPVLGP